MTPAPATPAPRLGRFGVWTDAFDLWPSEIVIDTVGELPALGYTAIWMPEALGREALSLAGWALGKTSDLTVATGIANLWARDAMAMANAHRSLSEIAPDRFLLGIGVSHAPIVEGLRNHRYGKPITVMREYLEAMDRAHYDAPPPKAPPRRVLAALGPKMLELAASHADGAHPYLVGPEHTAHARTILGADKILAVEQTVNLETDAERARTKAREFLAPYLYLPAYTRSFLLQGFSQADIAPPGSNRLIDHLVAWGGPEVIAERVRSHLDAGADHVCVRAIGCEGPGDLLRAWARLAEPLQAPHAAAV